MEPDEIPEVDTIDTIIGEHLRRERDDRRMSRPEVARIAAMSYKTIQRIEDGERSADMQQLESILNVYGLSVHTFMTKALRGTRFGDRAKSRPD